LLKVIFWNFLQWFKIEFILFHFHQPISSLFNLFLHYPYPFPLFIFHLKNTFISRAFAVTLLLTLSYAKLSKSRII
jgi:hypothetical protein